ncbi:lambda phage CII family protein [Serratia ficaria]|uniref:lambda phage CII family protein n=1 Tax=Serratia ficaria TaxID=61651 RepID=UPI00217AE31E|nr:lambda phage CII family protein [Serratia ficaria]CAI1021248.1 Bacteriophage CII protein [Serratia ficaria]
MELANYSKPTEQEINRAETDLLLTLSLVSNREFARLAECHESKISRTDWRYIATILCVAKKSLEFSPLGMMVQEVVNAVNAKKQKPLAATKGSEQQITINF